MGTVRDITRNSVYTNYIIIIKLKPAEVIASHVMRVLWVCSRTQQTLPHTHIHTHSPRRRISQVRSAAGCSGSQATTNSKCAGVVVDSRRVRLTVSRRSVTKPRSRRGLPGSVRPRLGLFSYSVATRLATRQLTGVRTGGHSVLCKQRNQ